MATAARTVMGKAYNRKRNRIDPVVKLALSIVPAAQVSNGSFREVNVANRTEADQRHSVRSRETRTIRRKTKIEKLRDAGVINAKEALACEWYAQAFACRYDTTGIT